ncbi:hypothetical protein QTP86_016954, partial [Hemibagrus guttatus]
MASRMNSAILVFLNDVDKVRKLTQNGIVVNNETILVSPLSSPAKKIMLFTIPRSARPDRKKPWSTEKSSVGSGAVLELPARTEVGAEVQGDRMETPDTTPVQGDGGDVDMVDEPVFKYTLNVTRDIVRSLKALEIEIVELQRLEATRNRGYIEALKSKKAKMNDLLDITAQGALVRSRFKSATEMDAPSKFFFSLEQKNGQKRFIHVVRTESGDLLSEPTEIHKQTVSFYSKLYSSEWSWAQAVEDSFLVGLPKLSERAARELDRELSLEELHEALQRMENGRASGIDGLPAEFYKAFWAVIGQEVLDVLRDSIRRGELPLSCRRAVLTLLPKKGDLTHLKNWRPVSLLCTDCKLLSKALSSRLTKVMERLIHQDQTYCVPDRSIFDNVYLIRDILDVSRLLGLKTGLIFLDQEKAFDRVEHEYLWKVLEAFGFNPGYRTAHWLLEEPLVYGGRLDISSVTVPALSRTLVSSGIVTLRELVNVAGSDLSRAEDLAARMGLRSLHVVNQLLHHWRSALTSEEHVQLMDYQCTETGPAEDEPFPRLNIAPDLDGCAGPLLECRSEGEMDF